MQSRDIGFAPLISVQELQKCSNLNKLAITPGVDELFNRDFVAARSKMAIIVAVGDYSKTLNSFDSMRDIIAVSPEPVLANLDVNPDIAIAVDFLRRAGYSNSKISVLKNPNKKEILAAIEAVPKSFSLFLFFAGHGIMIDDIRTCFAPADTKIKFADITSLVARDIGISRRKAVELNTAEANLLTGMEIRKASPQRTCLVADICHAEGFVKNAKPAMGIFSSHQHETSKEGYRGYTRDIAVRVSNLYKEVNSPDFDKFRGGGAFSNAFFQFANKKGIEEALKETNNALSMQSAGFFGFKKYIDKQGRKALNQRMVARRQRKDFVEYSSKKIRMLSSEYMSFMSGKKNSFREHAYSASLELKKTVQTFEQSNLLDIFNDPILIEENARLIWLMKSIERRLTRTIELIKDTLSNKDEINREMTQAGKESIDLVKLIVRHFRKQMDYDRQVQRVFCRIRELVN